MSGYCEKKYDRRFWVSPLKVVNCTTGSRTYPTAHATGEDVDEIWPRSTEMAKTENTLRRGVSKSR